MASYNNQPHPLTFQLPPLPPVQEKYEHVISCLGCSTPIKIICKAPNIEIIYTGHQEFRQEQFDLEDLWPELAAMERNPEEQQQSQATHNIGCSTLETEVDKETAPAPSTTTSADSGSFRSSTKPTLQTPTSPPAETQTTPHPFPRLIPLTPMPGRGKNFSYMQWTRPKINK